MDVPGGVGCGMPPSWAGRGVVSAIALGAGGPASRLAIWTHFGGERLAGATTAGTVAGAPQARDTTVVDQLPPPFGGAGIPAPVLPRPTFGRSR